MNENAPLTRAQQNQAEWLKELPLGHSFVSATRQLR